MCDVCEKSELVGVAASALGPFSCAYCGECLKRNAEPEWAFEATFESCGEEVADWVKRITTWKHGKYMPWLDWVELRKVEASNAE
ncbi:hypothetical protein F9K85_09625 [Brucella tritici]|uniref:hypothetical protein n=1 Tax=Brucella tritici TaxID=94626 RepID=UPI00124C891C|nr:hypothetical protein [Brucella tritici]KAB2676745.1 hypothetical protein F9K85_09625 [Brucella tritici]